MNELELLNQLKDIHLPAEIGLWPLAPGGWLVLTLTLLLVAALLYFGRKHHRKNAYRRAALHELKTIEYTYLQGTTGTADTVKFESALVQLLKRTALTAYPRSEVARLTGEQWLRTMDQLAGLNQFDTALGRCLLDRRFAPHGHAIDQAQAQALLKLARDWIKKHR